MPIEIKIPSPGESITEVELAEWFVSDGDQVEKDQEIGEVESDKATLPLISEGEGAIELLFEAGATIKVGEVVARVDSGKQGKKKEAPTQEKKKESTEKDKAKETQEEKATAKDPDSEKKSGAKEKQKSESNEAIKVTPVAQKMMEDNNLTVEEILKGLRRLGKNEVQAAMDVLSEPTLTSSNAVREESREKMSSLRKKLSKRLVAVKNETAMLTTFNEVDMSEVMALRKKHQPVFMDKHGIKLGFMSFFIKAATLALQNFPKVNSRIEGDEIVSPEFVDVGIAVQTGKGLMVPVIRNTESLSIPQMENALAELAKKARKNRISIEEMTGGTFSITNGGVFGSLLSTPILNPPQSAILGMHNIVDRPVAVAGKVEIRPMMYVALSYDHRIIDGKDSVSFLMKIKELIENPASMLLGGKNSDTLLLDI